MTYPSAMKKLGWTYIVFCTLLFGKLTFGSFTEFFSEKSTETHRGSSIVETDDVVNQIYPNGVNLTYVFNETKSRRQLALEVADFVCGVEGFCNASLSRGNFICTFDCKPCNCDKWCHYYGNCCPDLAFKDSQNLSAVAEDFLICPPDTWTTWNNISHIFMVGRCPPISDPIVARKCQYPDSTILDQATPVSLPTMVFRNVYCAQCYGVVDYDAWHHHVVCELGSDIQFATSKSDLWRRSVKDERCSIDTRPTKPVLINECYLFKYNTCNATGGATETPSEELEDLCTLYNHPVDYYGSTSTKKSYKNIFCAMCDGAILNTNMSCSQILFPDVPFPLNALLDFNPPPQASFIRRECEVGMAFDPVTKSCRNISCSLRRELVGNRCEDIFAGASGLGISFTALVAPVDPRQTIQNGDFKEQYLARLIESQKAFQPVLVTTGIFEFSTEDPLRITEGPADLAIITIRILSITTRSLSEFERTLMDFVTSDFIYQNANGSNISLSSSPYLCQAFFEIPSNHSKIYQMLDFTFHLLDELDQRCAKVDCNVYIHFEPIQLTCPFIEYNFSSDALTFDFEKKILRIDGQVIELSPKRFVKCGDIFKVCVEDIAKPIKVKKQVYAPEDDYTLSIVSLVCISLSLAGLVLTFITYSLIPKLRTLPGINTMALVMNLFLAQLLFLTTSNRTSSIILCQIFGVLVHYFWLSSFAWMSISAYHMYTVFTRFRAITRDPINNNHRIMRYTVICSLIPLCVVGACLTLNLLRSHGVEAGYGGRVCFLNNPISVGVFFAAPLILMLLLNTFFFVWTVRAISSVPDMKTSSNKQNKNHISAYFKLSLLFGFTWTFGLLAETVQSKILGYAFAILTGSQGLLIFVSYSFKMALDRLKEGINTAQASSPETHREVTSMKISQKSTT